MPGDLGKMKATNRPLPHLAGRRNPVVQSNQQGKISGDVSKLKGAARSEAAKYMGGNK